MRTIGREILVRSSDRRILEDMNRAIFTVQRSLKSKIGVVFENARSMINLHLLIKSMKKLLFFFALFTSSIVEVNAQLSADERYNRSIVTGAMRTELYLGDLINKNVGIVANQTSLIGETHLVDSLLALGIHVVKVFAPEHGFRGDSGAGETIKDGRDSKTGLPLISLYGKNKKPSKEMIADLDVLVFDIQDVGTRFYTYISTMHYVMEAAAESSKKVIVLDRPNPNGYFVDGPVLNPKYKSFVGLHPIPIVHGLTVGELAKMINGEKWLENQVICDVKVIPCEKYKHADYYELPVRPSPNLPNMSAVYLYPSLCWFEGTAISIGRGTDKPFQVIGYPGNPAGKLKFTPKDIAGIAKDPPHEGQECIGHDLEEFGLTFIVTSKALYPDWLKATYDQYPDKEKYFTSPDFFDKLAGSDVLRKQIIAGTAIQEIKKSWEADLKDYKILRKKYLLYPDFEQ
jgi:uncharacterized protein YbbC (DUF1343 family)